MFFYLLILLLSIIVELSKHKILSRWSLYKASYSLLIIVLAVFIKSPKKTDTYYIILVNISKELILCKLQVDFFKQN